MNIIIHQHMNDINFTGKIYSNICPNCICVQLCSMHSIVSLVIILIIVFEYQCINDHVNEIQQVIVAQIIRVCIRYFVCDQPLVRLYSKLLDILASKMKDTNFLLYQAKCCDCVFHPRNS